ncbi:MAG: hypothetical protein COZ06_33550 [Armatimonadetes bacterium CG_4_10_14_3_um_filter_66_18]|nr:hypothetical protein [Armatimonadota bacterium]OIP07006.1 MAG: hypothetical protein AUJ96_08310 [Armatimonadetes bacterium CG2_30_66_41]PIU94355.1 MAG: hypothetical protein COS65_08080 [Armatimonadetes bacterium CG06_land_8_20_14_3_00_66_21]PIX44616.1 MAG: hypothetical protein COZ57_17180 [Armatimonadetes bacterium CG_4_8_14_3_um_filter_66_20]PIY37094.1 MAG: hypothetical protein COZ06_33550 [Armatimonadetes bacterium CG_4_10_14_3_um_filter_66_18]PIZ37681.1 MAG: hypothetical protein COY42_23
MKLLEEITTFPEGPRLTLERQYGIGSAEAFYENAVRRPDGIQQALGIDQAELDRLQRTVEGYLAPDFVERCRQPVVRRPRGALSPSDYPLRRKAQASASSP